MTPPWAVLPGRASAEAQLRRLLESPRQVGVEIVEIRGAAGIGKTALLDRMASLARSQGIRCCLAVGTPAEQDRPFATIAALFDALVAQGDPRRGPATGLGQHELRDLAAALPSLRGLSPEPPSAGPDPLLVAHALRRLLAVGARTGRWGATLLLIDDAQWLDETSAAVLANIARNGTGISMLIGFARRSGAPIPAALTPTSLRPAPLTVIELEPLAREDSLQLLGAVPSDQREEILRVAGGNPFFLTELAAAVDSTPPAASSAGAPLTPFPTQVVAHIQAQVADLSEAARALVRSAAILGDPFEITLADRLADLSTEQAARAVDELVQGGLVTATEVPGMFRFRHPIVGSVIHDTSGPGWRRQAHHRAYTLLSESGADRIRVARHLELSAAPGDVAAAETLAQTAALARALAPQTSARLYATALRLLPPEAGFDDQRATWQGLRADALIAVGDAECACTELELALAAAGHVRVTARSALTGHLVRAQIWLGLDEAADVSLAAAVADLPPGPSFERMMLEALAMLRAAARGDVPATRRLGENLADGAAATGSALAVFSVSAARTLAAAATGPGEYACALGDEAGRLLTAMSSAESAMACEPIALLSTAETWLGRAERALHLAADADILARRSQNRAVEFMVAMNRCESLTALGQLLEAERAQSRAEELARLSGSANELCPAVAMRAALSVLRGDLSLIKQSTEECVTLLPLVRQRAARATAAVLVAPALVAAGEPVLAQESLLAHGGGPQLRDIAFAARSRCYESLVIAALAINDAGQAESWAGDAAAASDPDLPLTLVVADRAAAMVDQAQGRLDAAAATAERAATRADEAGAPVESARARLLAGRALAGMGDRDGAIDSLRDAYDAFVVAGAKGFAAEAAGELRELGIRPRRHAQAAQPDGLGAVSPLSVREVEIAELVADGLGNQEIAQQLFLSPRTVESHLSRIFNKLEVGSRQELGRAIRQLRYRAAVRPQDR